MTGPAASARAVVLAGGRGTRLAGFTALLPKPLVPVGDRPILDRLLEWLLGSGVGRVTLALGHHACTIREHVTGHPTFGRAAIDFVEEEQPLGTAGCLKTVPRLEDAFFAVNGDLLTDVDLRAMLQAHRKAGAALTVGRCVRVERTPFGVLELDADGFVTDYREKPARECSVSMGVYAYDPRALRHVGDGEAIDVPALVRRLLDRGERVATYLHAGLWLDVGSPEDYARAQALVPAADT